MYADDASKGYVPLQYLFAFFSPVMLAKGLSDLDFSAGGSIDNGTQ